MSAADVTVLLNGERVVMPPGATLADAVALVSAAPAGIAVAVDADVVPRSAWTTRLLRDGDAVEVLTAVQGG